MKFPRTAIFFILLGAAVQTAFARPLTQGPEGDCSLDIVRSSAVVLNATAQYDADQLQIRGYALRRMTNKSAAGGHVDFEVFSLSGNSLLVDHVALLPTPLPRGVHGRSSFRWTVPAQVTRSSRIELRYHTGAHYPTPSRATGS